MRNQNLIAAVVLSAAMLIAASMVTASYGRYSMSNQSSGGTVHILDRLTGGVKRCSFSECVVLNTQEQ